VYEISFDFETLSLDRDACILSLGAVRFDRETGELGRRFYAVAEIQNQPDAVIDAGTVEWWMRQSADAQAGIFGPGVTRLSLKQLLIEFHAYAQGAEWFWCRGNKDAEWMQSACQRCGLELPWAYWQVCDQRTLTNLFQAYVSPEESTGVAHNALDDAVRQAQALIDIFQASRDSGLVV